jgi:hypothetical protein
MTLQGAAMANGSQTAQTDALERLDLTDVLLATDFGFVVPDDSTITTVRVQVTRRSASHSLVQDREVSLSSGGRALDGNGAMFGPWSTSLTTQTYEFAIKNGNTVNPSVVKSPDFGVRLVAHNPFGSQSDVPEVDGMQVQVTYTCP